MAITLHTTLFLPDHVIARVNVDLNTSSILGCHTLCVHTFNTLQCQSAGAALPAAPQWQRGQNILMELVLAPERRATLMAGLAEDFVRQVGGYTHILMSGPVNIGTSTRDDGLHPQFMLSMAELAAALIEQRRGAVVTTPISRNAVHGDRHLSLVQTWVFIPEEGAAHSIPDSAATYGLNNLAEKASGWLRRLKITSVEAAHDRCLSPTLATSPAFKNCFNFFGNYS